MDSILMVVNYRKELKIALIRQPNSQKLAQFLKVLKITAIGRLVLIRLKFMEMGMAKVYRTTKIKVRFYDLKIKTHSKIL